MALPPRGRNLLWEYDLEDPRVLDRLDRVVVGQVAGGLARRFATD
ncbi:MAG: hypothetical protein V2I67_07565 [Thermoanaerobaculales bacterium]|nr:hypothetical protein [Thermoanaerobaculales bacterium]